MIEKWRDVVGYEGQYQVSNLGKIRILKIKGKSIEPRLKYFNTRKDRYVQTKLQKDNKFIAVKIHNLVLEAFSGPRPEHPTGGKIDGSHIDGSRDNNCIDNLVWETSSQNNLRRHQHKTMPNQKGIGNPHVKLTEQQVLDIRKSYSEGSSKNAISKKFHITRRMVKLIVERTNWSHI